MKVTEVKIRKLFNEGPMKAVASVTFDNCFTVHDIKVIEAGDRKFVVMPGVKTETGTFRDTAHPINAEFRKELTQEVMQAYEVQLAMSNTVQ